jgi:hypothetical protein
VLRGEALGALRQGRWFRIATVTGVPDELVSVRLCPRRLPSD